MEDNDVELEPVPDLLHRTVVIDPPWEERGGGKRGANEHYTLMKECDIEAQVRQWMDGQMAKDSHMYLWVTNTFLKMGLRLMEAWGYRYVTNLVWNKDRFGLGRYFRGKHELVLFGVKGKRAWDVRTPANDIAGAFGGKRRQHSRKPEEFYTKVEDRSHGPYLELFGRSQRPGWTVMGDQTNMFAPITAPAVTPEAEERIAQYGGFYASLPEDTREEFLDFPEGDVSGDPDVS